MYFKLFVFQIMHSKEILYFRNVYCHRFSRIQLLLTYRAGPIRLVALIVWSQNDSRNKICEGNIMFIF